MLSRLAFCSSDVWACCLAWALQVLAQNFVATLMMIAFRYAAIFHGTDEHGEPIQGSVHMFVLFDWWGWWGIVTCFLTGFATTQCIFMGIHYMRAGSENAEDGGIATSMKTTWERFEDVDTYSSAGKLESVCSSRARPVEPIMFVVRPPSMCRLQRCVCGVSKRLPTTVHLFMERPSIFRSHHCGHIPTATVSQNLATLHGDTVDFNCCVVCFSPT